jgi:hypothetical protein
MPGCALHIAYIVEHMCVGDVGFHEPATGILQQAADPDCDRTLLSILHNVGSECSPIKDEKGSEAGGGADDSSLCT